MTGRAVAAFLVLAVVACGPGEQVDVVTTSTVPATSTTTGPTDPDRSTTTAPADMIFEMSGGTPFHLSVVADVPGIFEVEAHTGHNHLFDLRVVG